MPNNDLISREALFRAWDNLADDFTDVDDYIDEMIKLAQDVPAVDAASVVHGRWMRNKHKIFGNIYDYVCSVCGCDYALAEYNYCPNCGAKMDRGGNDGSD